MIIVTLKDYFTWAPKLPKKSCYDMDEVWESFEHRKETTFENHYLNVYYWFKRNFDFLWNWHVFSGYTQRAYQIVTRPGHWSDRDIWSLDYTIAKFALPRLIRLKEVMHGVPNTMFEPLPEGEYNHNEEQVAAALKKWNETLDEIIFAMDYVANCREHDYYPKKKWPEKTTKDDYAELLAVEKRAQDGLILFGTYFRNLWD
jgi:hypothetical protein